MKSIIVVMMIFLPAMLLAQKLHVNILGGTTNYQGDLQDKPFTLSQANFGAGVGLSYDITNHFAVRGELLFGKLSADDKKNTKAALKARNLNFKSGLSEFSASIQYQLFDLSEKRWTPYAFAGLAVFHFNPYTNDSIGNKYFLRDLSTEGQGLALYPDRKPYKLTQFAIPFGGGIKMRVADNIVVGYEIGLRKTFTDYIDDVSKTYVDETALLAAKGAKAVELAYRGDEIKNGNAVYPLDGTIRGNPTSKDWYYVQGITVSFTINTNKSSFKGFGNNRGRTGCPTKVL